MPAGLGVAQLIITDKRSDGYITDHAWGMDWPMEDVDRVRRLSSISAQRGVDQPEWKLTNTIAIPEINAVALAPAFSVAAMDLPLWKQISSTYWREVQPFGFGMAWIKMYDARPGQTGAIASLPRLPKNPSWGLRFLRTAVPSTQTDPVYLSITLNAYGSTQYQLYIRQDEGHYPVLYKSTDGGATAEIVDVFASEQAARWAAAAFNRPQWISCLFVPDHLILRLGDIADPWVYAEPDLDITEGAVLVGIGGGQLAFHLEKLTFASSGSIEGLRPITPPDFVNAVADTMSHQGDAPTGTTITPTMETDAGKVWPKAALTGDGDHTPLLYSLQATRPAVHAAAVATSLFDNTDPAHQGKLESAEFTIAQGWRGSSFTARVRTSGGYDFTGNEKASLAIALDTGGGISYTTQVTGYLQSPALRKTGGDPGAVILDLSAVDRLQRLRNKAARLLPSFAGWTFEDAFTWLLHECAGFPTGDLNLDALAGSFTYPAPPGQQLLKFDHTLDLVAVADELARAAGREWGIDQSGDIFTRALGTVVYSGTPDWTLDEDTVTEADVCYFAEIERDLMGVRNHVLVIGKDRDGNDVLASWRYAPSVSDPAADPFIGDDWWEVRIAPDGADPWLIAAFTGTELLKYRGLLTWETDGKPTLFPDHYVKVQTTGLQIPTDTVFRIVEKWGHLDSQGECTTRFLGVMEQ